MSAFHSSTAGTAQELKNKLKDGWSAAANTCDFVALVHYSLDAEILTEHNRVLRLTNTNLVVGNQGGTKLATLILCVGILVVGLGSFDLNVCLCA